MDHDLTWLADIGLDMTTGLSYTGSQDKYVSALQRYCKNREKNHAAVLNYFATKDHENYMITVHALKSNSRMIGAKELGDAFAELEEAARSGDTGIIEMKTAPVLASYNSLVEKLQPIFEIGEVHAADEIPAGAARETAEKLLDALDDFDDDLSRDLVKKLSGYPFRITQRDKLKQAADLIDDFMYDEAAGLIREIYPAIE